MYLYLYIYAFEHVYNVHNLFEYFFFFFCVRACTIRWKRMFIVAYTRQPTSARHNKISNKQLTFSMPTDGFFFNCCCYLFNFFSLSMQYMLAGLQVGFFYTYTSSNCCCCLIFENHSLKKKQHAFHWTNTIKYTNLYAQKSNYNNNVKSIRCFTFLLRWSSFIALHCMPFAFDTTDSFSSSSSSNWSFRSSQSRSLYLIQYMVVFSNCVVFFHSISIGLINRFKY